MSITCHKLCKKCGIEHFRKGDFCSERCEKLYIDKSKQDKKRQLGKNQGSILPFFEDVRI